MDVHTNIPLKNYLTIRLGGPTRFMADASTNDELIGLLQQAKSQNLSIFILGSGSNTLAADAGFDGLVIRMRQRGLEIVAEDASTLTIKCAAGEIWDDVVKWSVEHNLTGIDAMSAIPGTMGAAPVQNIGAYGQELADTFRTLTAYDMQTEQIVTMNADDCGFSYRHSIFRGDAMGRYIILDVTLALYKASPEPPFYRALQDYFDANGVTLFTPQIVREAVTAIRRDKLPDPAERPNSGSFFKNAIIENWQLTELLKDWPDIPHYDLGNNTFKVPTGWLIEQVGVKGSLLHGMRVNDKNALVLINESATSFEDLVAAREEIIGKVRDTFRISISQEPLEIR